MAAGRSYRTNIELLRDFLRAAREPTPKTRLIGAANMNPLSFRKYLQYCTDNGLIVHKSGGYMATPRAAPILEAIDGVIAKTAELEQAVQVLKRNATDLPVPNEFDGGALRYVSRETWNEFVLERTRTGPRPGAARTDPSSAGYRLDR